MILFLRLGLEWSGGEWKATVGLLALWIIAGMIRAALGLPTNLQCLLLLDESGGWRDRFSSAWEFAVKEAPTGEEQAHVLSSVPRLEKAVRQFPENYTSPRMIGAVLVMVGVVVLALIPVARVAPEVSELVLTPKMQEVAAQQAEGLQAEAEKMKGGDSLSEEERAELEELRVAVEDVAESLAEADGLTAGEMLESLESRARSAEKLAEKLGLSQDEWASAEMLAEMAQHADTVDLALTIKDKEAEAAAAESMRLQGVLDQEALTADTQDRLTSTLEQVVAAATEIDEEKPVGERFGNASRKLSDGQVLTAAREFEELARHFRFLAERLEAQEKLEELASNLREAGAEVSGSELERMEQIASESATQRATPSGLEAIEAGDLPEDLQKMLAPQMGSSGAQPAPLPGQNGEAPEGSDQKAPVPGMAEGAPEPSGSEEGEGSMALTAPVPGEAPPSGPSGASGQGTGASDQAQDGQGEGGILSAPIPGEAPGEQGDGGAGMSLAGNPGASQGQGGDQAGTGTASMIDNETEAIAAAQDGEVVAQINEDGESSVRAVEGQARAGNATRSRQEIVAEFLSAEEQALDGKSIPLSRREHIIRYFSAIRKQFEESETAP
ncbi:MAG: hypothetical protein P1U85_03570 [Verrucomicrobiales bacterium]|nr:hypothetical protein [Verrucomicrobiales bacterium]